MPFTLTRATPTGDATGELELARAHAEIAAPRRGTIAWDAFERGAYGERALEDAAEAWRARAVQEFHSLALFTQIASQLHLLGAPLDWSGAFARMIGDEVRHTELCARMCEALGSTKPLELDPGALHLVVEDRTLRAHVRRAIVAAFCIGETLSGRMFRRCLRVATVPLAKDVVRAIVDDETFHGQFGWEAAALLMRPDGPDFDAERAALASALPEMFAHYRHLSAADRGEAWARSEPEAEPAPNFGTLSFAGYARAFYDGMKEDVIPGLVAIGLPEARPAWDSLGQVA